MQRSQHIRALDGIRGIAILMVLAHTFNTLDSSSGLAHVFEYLLDTGWAGVQLFFVLSGFLITGILIDTRQTNNFFVSFYARRALRIFPLYYTALITFFVILPLFSQGGHQNEQAHHQIWLWTYLVNWTEPLGRGVSTFSHFWSLAVEEQFYLVWPFIVFRLSNRQVLQLSLVLIAAALATRIGMTLGHVNPEAVYMFTMCRMDALAAGAAIAVTIRTPEFMKRLESQRHLVWPLLISLLLAGAFICHGYHRIDKTTQTLGYLVLTLVFALVVFANATNSVTPSLWKLIVESHSLVSVGKYSYAMYIFGMLIHRSIGLILLNRLGPNVHSHLWPAFLYAATLMLVTYLCAFGSYHVLERHFLSMKKHFPSSTSPAIGEPA